jgi:hypothetical protein
MDSSAGSIHVVLGGISVKAVGSVRRDFAFHHLNAALISAQTVFSIEEKHKAEPFGPFFEEIMAHASQCVLSSASALEAYINGIFVDACFCAGNEPEGFMDQFPAEFPNVKRAILIHYWDQAQSKASILDKFNTASIYRLGKALSSGHNLHSEAGCLIELRNALTHFKPRWDSEPELPLEKRLKSKFSRSHWFPSPEPLFPMGIMSYACAKWSVETGLNFIRFFSQETGIENRFERFASRLVLP